MIFHNTPVLLRVQFEPEAGAFFSPSQLYTIPILADAHRFVFRQHRLIQGHTAATEHTKEPPARRKIVAADLPLDRRSTPGSCRLASIPRSGDTSRRCRTTTRPPPPVPPHSPPRLRRAPQSRWQTQQSCFPPSPCARTPTGGNSHPTRSIASLHFLLFGGNIGR